MDGAPLLSLRSKQPRMPLTSHSRLVLLLVGIPPAPTNNNATHGLSDVSSPSSPMGSLGAGIELKTRRRLN